MTDSRYGQAAEELDELVERWARARGQQRSVDVSSLDLLKLCACVSLLRDASDMAQELERYETEVHDAVAGLNQLLDP